MPPKSKKGKKMVPGDNSQELKEGAAGKTS